MKTCLDMSGRISKKGPTYHDFLLVSRLKSIRQNGNLPQVGMKINNI